MIIKRFIVVALTVLSTACAAEENKKDDWWVKCKPVADAINEISKSHQNNIAAVEKILKKNSDYPNCNDGFYGEGMSDIVVKALASDFANVVKATLSNKKLDQFVIAHIDSTTDWTDLDQITSHAKTNCPPNGKEFCARVRDLSIQASKDAKAAAKK